MSNIFNKIISPFKNGLVIVKNLADSSENVKRITSKFETGVDSYELTTKNAEIMSISLLSICKNIAENGINVNGDINIKPLGDRTMTNENKPTTVSIDEVKTESIEAVKTTENVVEQETPVVNSSDLRDQKIRDFKEKSKKQEDDLKARNDSYVEYLNTQDASNLLECFNDSLTNLQKDVNGIQCELNVMANDINNIKGVTNVSALLYKQWKILLGFNKSNQYSDEQIQGFVSALMIIREYEVFSNDKSRKMAEFLKSFDNKSYSRRVNARNRYGIFSNDQEMWSCSDETLVFLIRKQWFIGGVIIITTGMSLYASWQSVGGLFIHNGHIVTGLEVANRKLEEQVIALQSSQAASDAALHAIEKLGIGSTIANSVKSGLAMIGL